MTENLLQKLEERMMMLLAEVEDLRNQVQRLMYENVAMKSEKESSAKKLQDLISLLDTLNAPTAMPNAVMAGAKPVLIQEAVG